MLAEKLAEPVYPSSDGKRMAENTVQYDWIVTIKGGLDVALPDFVAGDLLWYPVRGSPQICQAPDVLVALGRPKGHRMSYKQWEEDNVAPQVVFEVLSPGNTFQEMGRKLLFYLRYGVQEYYLLDPDAGVWTGYVRHGEVLDEVIEMDGHQSPLLGIRFGFVGEEPALFHVDGARFQTFDELSAAASSAQAELIVERARAEAERTRADALLARLKALGIDPTAL